MSKDKKYDSPADKSYSDYIVSNGKFQVFGFIAIGIVGFFIWVVKSHDLNVHADTFEFHSETKYDSVFVKVCGLQTKLFDHKERDEHNQLYIHSGNLVGPAKGYPCSIQFTVFKGSKTKILDAPDFNCHGCDVAGHQYIYNGTTVNYKLRH